MGIRRPMTDRRPPLCENPLQYSHPCDNASADDDAVDYDCDSQETKVILELYWSHLMISDFDNIHVGSCGLNTRKDLTVFLPLMCGLRGK